MFYTNFNSRAPTFFNKSPTIPSAEILKTTGLVTRKPKLCQCLVAVIGTKPQVGSDKNIHEPEPTKMLYETRRQDQLDQLDAY